MTDKNNMIGILKMGWRNRNYIVFSIAMLMLTGFSIEMKNHDSGKIRVVLSPNKGELMTQKIQMAIDSCDQKGGGVVVFSAGTYISGGIELKSHVSLQIEKGAILQGSKNYTNYSNDAFIFGKNLSEIAIQGEGMIDGVDCYDPKGEEGFRGPHCIRLVGCKNIILRGISIKNSANYAINCRHCSTGMIDHVIIRGGHDGLHTRFCDNFKVDNCDFRTGDDAFAGNDNRNFVIIDSKINTSCNGFRIGCYNFTVKNCKLWGPGEYIHKSQTRNNMLSAFVHFSPKDENPRLKSGNWLIKDVTVENVDQFFVYNFKDGLWQTGQPMTSVEFKNVKANGILGAFNIIGDQNLKFRIKVENSSFCFRDGADYKGKLFEGAKLLSPALFNAVNFDQIELKNVILKKRNESLILNCNSGNSLTFEHVNFMTGNNSKPYSIDKVKEVRKVDLKLNSIRMSGN